MIRNFSLNRSKLQFLKKNIEKVKAENFKLISKKVGWYLALGNAASIGLQILMVPILIFYWGVALYGEWIILFTIPAFLSLTDLGIIAVSNNILDKLCAQKKYISANKVFSTSLIILFFLVFTVSILGFCFWYFLDYKIISIFEKTNPSDIKFLYFIMLFDSLISIFLNHKSALYRTINKFHWTSNWQNFGRILPLCSVFLVAASGFYLLEAAILMIVTRFFILLIMLLDINGRINWLRLEWFGFSKRYFKLVFFKAMGFFALPVSNMVVLHLVTILIAANYNPSVVAMFNSLRTFTRLIPQFVGIIGKSLWSEIAKGNSSDNNVLLYKFVLNRTLILSSIFLFIYLILGRYFFEIWTHSLLKFDYLLFVFLVLNALVIAIYTSLEVFLLARNEVGVYSFLFMICSLIQVGLGWIFSDNIGIISYPLFGFLGSLFMSIYLIINNRKYELKK